MKRIAARRSRVASPPPFHHILIPSDLTARTRIALDAAEKLLLTATSRITVLHVIETIDGLGSRELYPFYRRLERKARTTLSTLVKGRAAETAIDVAVVRGRRAETVVSYAKANAIDLIVVSSHRVNPSMANRDWGSISYKVAILAHCPVLLVK
jgi:nucleotide-binding universal stress UspA family protein